MKIKSHASVGISDIALYLPKLKIDLETIVAHRAKEVGNLKIEKLLRRAVKSTGVISMRFPDIWEDSVTMAAQAMLRLIKKNPAIVMKALRYVAAGTETTVDHAKPIAAYAIGLLKKAGIKIPHNLSTFQTQHACAGGTLALLGIAALLTVSSLSQSKPDFKESGIVVCTDIARYKKGTTAEITQGAGAVAMLVETDPKLLSLDLATTGYSSKDVDDFFRPLGSDIAKVKGRFSIRCYIEALEEAFLNHCERRGISPKEAISSTDLFVLHVPYPNMPLEAMEHLLHKFAGMSKEEAHAHLEEKDFFSMIAPASKSGNIYSGSMFMSLAFLLQTQYQKHGRDIAGKTMMLASYGSGNTMSVISGLIAKEAAQVIEGWDLNTIWQDKIEASIHRYETWADSNGISPEQYARNIQSEISSIEPGKFYLERIREDGYREYSQMES